MTLWGVLYLTTSLALHAPTIDTELKGYDDDIREWDLVSLSSPVSFSGMVQVAIFDQRTSPSDMHTTPSGYVILPNFEMVWGSSADFDNPLSCEWLDKLRNAIIRQAKSIHRMKHTSTLFKRLFGPDHLLLVNDMHLRAQLLPGQTELRLIAKSEWHKNDVPTINKKLTLRSGLSPAHDRLVFKKCRRRTPKISASVLFNLFCFLHIIGSTQRTG